MLKISIIGFGIVSIIGTIFHFLYNYIPFFIFPINESIFEHTKLVLFPLIIYFIILLFFHIENKKELFTYFFTGIISGILSVIILYYTYSGITGVNNDIVNIIIYFISIFISFVFIYKKVSLFSFQNSIILLIIIILFTFIFTYYPLEIPFFTSN